MLFVDDDEDWRLVVRTWLEDAGYMVLTAGDGTEAITKAGKIEFDLIILDLDLNGESGLILMKFLIENHPGVPIILYTSTAQDDAKIQAMRQQGARHYLIKGKKEDLLNSIRQTLKTRGSAADHVKAS